jgi:thiosulfate dehydrogenase
MFLVSCSSSKPAKRIVHGNAVEHGEALFDDPKASPSASNAFTCGTCHRDDPSTRVTTGARLAGAPKRKTFWGGKRVDLLEAINDCRRFFMDAPRPWTTDDEDARAMYAFLTQLGPADERPAPFTIVSPVDLPKGDATTGATLFGRACEPCHGSVHEGGARLATFIPALPDEVVRKHAAFKPQDLRLVFIGKVRGGAFHGGGSMPPFSREVLSDQDLAAILTYFALY